MRPTIAFIGFGEAAQAFASGFRAEPVNPSCQTFDIKLNGPDASAIETACTTLGVTAQPTSAAACKPARAIFSMVTAEEAATAAATAAQTPLNGTLFLDCNSCAPDTKRQSEALITTAGGRYVDVAIMTPVHPKLHRSPCLVSGPHAEAATDLMQTLGMTASIAGAEIGAASGRKMIRSVMIKGLEALTLECFLAARKFGIEDDIMASLDKSYPGFDWPTRAPYMMERAMTHGIRRAAEMREVAKTLHDLGIAPHMTTGTVARQQEVGDMALNAADIGEEDLRAMADAILSHLPQMGSELKG